MQLEVVDSPEYFALQQELGISGSDAIGLLWMFEYVVGRQAPLGNIGKYNDRDIHRMMRAPASIEPAALVDALIKVGLLEECARHRLVVPHWRETMPDWARKILKRRDQMAVLLEDHVPEGYAAAGWDGQPRSIDSKVRPRSQSQGPLAPRKPERSPRARIRHVVIRSGDDGDGKFTGVEEWDIDRWTKAFPPLDRDDIVAVLDDCATFYAQKGETVADPVAAISRWLENATRKRPHVDQIVRAHDKNDDAARQALAMYLQAQRAWKQTGCDPALMPKPEDYGLTENRVADMLATIKKDSAA